jgi:hypothetical protein
MEVCSSWGLQPQLLRKTLYLAPTLGREEAKRVFDGGVGALHGVLEAYMKRRYCRLTMPIAKERNFHIRWPKVGVKLPSMLWVVAVLFLQHNDQLKIG